MSNSSPKDCNINNVILNSANNDQQDNRAPQSLVQSQADTDQQLISLWLHNRSIHTQKAYSKDITMMSKFVGKGIRNIKLQDLQDFADYLKQQNYEPSSQHRILAAVKSLFSFAHKIGYVQFNTAKPLIIPKFKDRLAERILSEDEVKLIIAKENNPRNKLILRVFYATGIRVSELCSLTWDCFQQRDNRGQMTVFTKGGKTNTIIIPENLWKDLVLFKNTSSEKIPVFKSRNNKALDPSQVWRIVRKAAIRVGIDKNVSCHWLRHAHCTHALNRGAKISLVQSTLSHASISTTGKYIHINPDESSSLYIDV